MTIRLEGRARLVGDDISIDAIVAPARKRVCADENALARWLLEEIDPSFASSVRRGDILVAGRNFGGGAAMELVSKVIVAAGIRAVLATTFSRSFYRNAINTGLLPVECDTAAIRERDCIVIRMLDDSASVLDETTGLVIQGKAVPPIMLEILQAGGLAPYLRQRRPSTFKDWEPPAAEAAPTSPR